MLGFQIIPCGVVFHCKPSTYWGTQVKKPPHQTFAESPTSLGSGPAAADRGAVGRVAAAREGGRGESRQGRAVRAMQSCRLNMFEHFEPGTLKPQGIQEHVEKPGNQLWLVHVLWSILCFE